MRILDKILFCIACIIATSLIIYLVVIPSPKEFTSYLALSFVIVLDALCFLAIFPILRNKKKRPKTVSKRLIFWLAIVLYSCFIGVGFLINAYFLSETMQAKAMVTVSCCVIGAMGAAAFFTLVWIVIEYFSILNCLKHGEKLIAEFVGIRKSTVYDYGDPKSMSYSSIRLYSVGFKFIVDGSEIIKNSKRIFTWDEACGLRNKQSLNIKYNGRVAVIDEIPEELPVE